MWFRMNWSIIFFISSFPLLLLFLLAALFSPFLFAFMVTLFEFQQIIWKIVWILQKHFQDSIRTRESTKSAEKGKKQSDNTNKRKIRDKVSFTWLLGMKHFHPPEIIFSPNPFKSSGHFHWSKSITHSTSILMKSLIRITIARIHLHFHYGRFTAVKLFCVGWIVIGLVCVCLCVPLFPNHPCNLIAHNDNDETWTMCVFRVLLQ